MRRSQMKTLFKILFTPLLWLLNSCSPLGNPVDIEKSNNHYYDNSKSQIRYSRMGNWFELGNTQIKADVQSFQVLNKWLSRDKDHIFFEAHPVENLKIDANEFYIKNEDYMTNLGFDNEHVYAFETAYKNKKTYSIAKVIENANPKTFMRTGWSWANDKKNHFYGTQKLDTDFDSFEILNDYFAKDSIRGFVRNAKIFEPFEADTPTLHILDESSHGIDKNNVYWITFFTKKGPYLLTIPYTDASKVKFLNRYFLQIDNRIYFDGVFRKDIDTQSFEIINLSYAKDAAHVYYKGQPIEGADAASFKQMEGSYKYQDKNGIYHEGELDADKPEATN